VPHSFLAPRQDQGAVRSADLSGPPADLVRIRCVRGRPLRPGRPPAAWLLLEALGYHGWHRPARARHGNDRCAEKPVLKRVYLVGAFNLRVIRLSHAGSRRSRYQFRADPASTFQLAALSGCILGRVPVAGHDQRPAVLMAHRLREAWTRWIEMQTEPSEWTAQAASAPSCYQPLPRVPALPRARAGSVRRRFAGLLSHFPRPPRRPRFHR
jgi:hypothetical protein